MKQVTDDQFRELYSPLSKGAGFITDASRRRVVDKLKKQNFLAFNPLQFNVFYLTAAAVIVTFILAALISNSVSDDANGNDTATDFHTLKRETPAPKKDLPPTAKTPVSAPIVTADTAKQTVATKDTAIAKPAPEKHKSDAPATSKVDFSGVKHAKNALKSSTFSEFKGLPALYAKPQISKQTVKELLPKMPDSLPVLKKPAVRPKPLTLPQQPSSASSNDSVKPAAADKKDTTLSPAPQPVTDPVSTPQPAPAADTSQI